VILNVRFGVDVTAYPDGGDVRSDSVYEWFSMYGLMLMLQRIPMSVLYGVLLFMSDSQCTVWC